MRYTVSAFVALSITLVACGPAAPGVGQRATLADDGRFVTDLPPATQAVYEAPPARVWLAVEAAYKSLGIDPTTEDLSLHTIGNMNFTKMRTLGPTRLSKFVDCGSGPSGSKADSYRITFSVLSILTSQPGGKTSVDTQVIPSAVDVSGNSSDRIPCGSTGELERQIHVAVRTYLTP